MNTVGSYGNWVYICDQSLFFSTWALDPGESTSGNLRQRLGTPILQQGELRSCPGERIYAAVQVDPPLASKTTGLDDKQLYFHVAHHTQVGVPRKNLSTKQRKNPTGTVELIRHWLRPVNNYKIIIIQSQHWT